MVVAEERETPQYRTKIIKAGALLADTRSLFAYWDPALSRSGNLERLRTSNILGKESRSRMGDVLAIFRQRFLRDPGTAEALATLVQGNAPASILTPIFYFHAVQNDPLLHDVVTEFLVPLQWQGRAEVATEQLVQFLVDQVRLNACR